MTKLKQKITNSKFILPAILLVSVLFVFISMFFPQIKFSSSLIITLFLTFIFIFFDYSLSFGLVLSILPFKQVFDYWTSIILGVFALVFAVKYLLQVIKKQNKILIAPLILNVVIALWNLYNLNISNITALLNNYILLAIFYLTVVNFKDFNKQKAFYVFLAGLLTSCLIGGILGLIPITKELVFHINEMRFRALTYNTNALQIFCSISIGVLLYLIISKKINVLPFGLLSITLAVVGLLTKSKAFLIILALIVFILMIYLLIKNKKLFLVAIIVLLLLSIIFKDIIVQILDRFTKYGHKDFIDKIFTGRVTIWENYFNACTSSFKNFMLGFGATTNHLNNISAHNTYLELLYRNGFIGIILLLSLIISYFVIIVKKYNGNVKYANLISILALLLIAFEESLLPIFGPFIILVLIFTFDIKTNNLQFKEKKMTFKRIKHALINLIVSPFFWGKPKVMDSRQTVEYILKNNVSIGRFGDGELNLMSGCGIKFQKYDKALADKLKSLKTDDKFLVCIPNIFDKEYFNKNVLVDGEYKFWKKYKSNNNFILKKYFNKQIVCGDTEVSRFYIRYKDKSGVAEYIKLFKKLWEKRNVIIVEGATSKVGCENDLLNNALSIRRIIGPSKDAYDYYDEILQTVKQNYKKGDLVLLALGPTATALAYDLSKSGIQALDLGHFDIEYEWFLANATEKIPVKNKHVNECNSMGEENSTDEKYNKEIVYKIKVT